VYIYGSYRKNKIKLGYRFFGPPCRLTRGSISPCNIAGLISNVSEDVLMYSHPNRQHYCRRRQPHCHLTPPPRETPAKIRIGGLRLIFLETRIIWLHFCRSHR